MDNNKKSQIEIINKEINTELANAEVSRALLATTFKGLTPVAMKQAIMDGMIRGFSFLNFRQKDVYAVPYGQGYSLITSIDYSRKIGMRSGICGKEEPIYVMDGEKIISCSVTVLRRMDDGYVGKYTAKVFFKEYSTGKNLWVSKPMTMIAKVAEMHALRMACPEELSKQYIEEEMELGDKNIMADRVDVAIEDSKPLTMGNLQKNGENKKGKESSEDKENQNEVRNAESDEINPFTKDGK